MGDVGKILSANIHKYRKLSCLTQDALALKLGVTFQAVSKWENGKSLPDVLLIPLLADAFGCSIDDLFSFVSKNGKKNITEFEVKQIKSEIGDRESAEKFLSIIAMDGGTDLTDEKIKQLIGEVYHSIANKEDKNK